MKRFFSGKAAPQLKPPATGPGNRNAPPLSTVDVTLKYHRPTFANEVGALVMAEAFPRFLDEGPTAKQVEEAKAMMARGNVGAVVLMPRRRRYAGIMERLPRGRYYSVCSDKFGNDNGTVAAEMLAYWDVSAGPVEVFDLTMPDDAELVRAGYESAEDGLRLSGMGIDLVPQEGRPHPIAEKLFARNLIDRSHIDETIRVIFPLVVEHQHISNVLDLRQYETQQWLLQFLPPGDDDFLVTANKLSTFPLMLPSFMDPELGGGDFTVAFGMWLQNAGANGLIYPSARTDVYCSFKNGKLDRYSGWNFVDYRTDAESFDKRGIAVFHGRWTPGFLEGVKLVVAQDNPTWAGSWRVEGNFAAHVAQRQARLEAFRTDDAEADSNVGQFTNAIVDLAIRAGLNEADVRKRLTLWRDSQSLADYHEKCRSGTGYDLFDVRDVVMLLRWSIEEDTAAPDFRNLQYHRDWYLEGRYDEGNINISCPRCGWTYEFAPRDEPEPTACPDCGLQRVAG